MFEKPIIAEHFYLLGKIVTVKYFEIFTDEKTGTQSLRFPVLKSIRGNKEEE